jgi:hypothetical protein
MPHGLPALSKAEAVGGGIADCLIRGHFNSKSPALDPHRYCAAKTGPLNVLSVTINWID